MKHKQGDMFTTEATAIGHGCNVRGVMGAGVAAIVARKYPGTKERYVQRCSAGNLNGGDVLVTREKMGGPGEMLMIFNMMTQINPGSDARLDLVTAAAQKTADLARMYEVPVIAIPQIGCGIGGLKWEDVEPILQSVETDDFEWEVWTL